MSRRSKLTQETQQKVVDAITLGAVYALAAQYAGITETTMYNWMKRGREEIERLDENGRTKLRKSEVPFVKFFEAVKRAEGAAAMGWLAMVEKAAVDTWQAAAWKLERRYPRDYGRQVTEHTGEVNAVIIDR